MMDQRGPKHVAAGVLQYRSDFSKIVCIRRFQLHISFLMPERLLAHDVLLTIQSAY